MIKYGGKKASIAVFRLFTMLWELEKIPGSWRRSAVVPVHKKGSVFDPVNYRPITLMPHLMKLYERIVDGRVREVVKIPPEQSGYRAGHGSIRQLIRLQQILKFQQQKNSETYLAFLDLKQAYDWTWRDGLFYRLWEAGVRGKCWRIIVDFYKSNKTMIKTNFGNTKLHEVEVGVLQGSVLSPILFLVFINPIIAELRGSGIMVGNVSISSFLFCDDICLISSSKATRAQQLEATIRFMKKWRIQLSTGKQGKSILVNQHGQDEAQEEVENTIFPVSKSAVYLGVEVEARGVYSRRHALGKLASGMRALRKLQNLGIRPGQLRADIAVGLLKSLVNSKVTYGYELLMPTSGRIELLNSMQVAAAKQILGLHPKTDDNIVLAESGLVHMKYLAARAVLITTNKIFMDSEDSITSHIIEANYELGGGWVDMVDKAAELLDYKACHRLGNQKTSSLAELLKKKMAIAQKREWMAAAKTAGMEDYCFHAGKLVWGPEPCLLFKKHARNTAALIRFRCGKADLLQGNGMCRLCGLELESYTHVLMECANLEHPRTVLWEILKREAHQCSIKSQKPKAISTGKRFYWEAAESACRRNSMRQVSP
jgi:hypothetical protein